MSKVKKLIESLNSLKESKDGFTFENGEFISHDELRPLASDNPTEIDFVNAVEKKVDFSLSVDDRNNLEDLYFSYHRR